MAEVPSMMRYLFGEAAETAEREASERLRRWAAAFEAWLEERGQVYGRDSVKQAKLAWGRLLQQQRRMPWELTGAEIEKHAEWMRAEGYSPNTIYAALGYLLSFYRWCSEREVDPECVEGFNPAEGVRRRNPRRYEGAKLLSREEICRLLRTMQRDPSELGKRDYAFTLARLKLGAALRDLRQLRWGQIEEEAQGRWVRWRNGEQ